MEVFWCATGLGRGGFARPAGCASTLMGDLASGIPRIAAAGGGLRLHHSPPSSSEGDLASGIPHSAAAGD